MAVAELSRKAARLFNQYRVPNDKGFDWALEIDSAKSEKDLSPELQEFLAKPYLMTPVPKDLQKHLAGTHDQSTHGRKGGGSFPNAFDAGSYDRATKSGGYEKAVKGLTRPDGSPLDPSIVQSAGSRAAFRSTKVELDTVSPSLDKAFDSLDEQANDFIKRQPVSVFMPEESVEDLLDSGTYLTVFNLDPSLKGEDYLDHRTIYEKVAFGYDSDLDPYTRPVSGAVLLDGIKAGNDGYLTNQYGQVQLVLKDDVKSRTTYTIGDSLDNFAKPTKLGGEFPRNINNINVASSAFRYSNNNDGKNMFDTKAWHSRSYLEAQVHGGVKLSDISKVILHYPEGYFDTGRLEELGIPFEVNDGGL
jgi:hypothetical protein